MSDSSLRDCGHPGPEDRGPAQARWFAYLAIGLLGVVTLAKIIGRHADRDIHWRDWRMPVVWQRSLFG